MTVVFSFSEGQVVEAVSSDNRQLGLKCCGSSRGATLDLLPRMRCRIPIFEGQRLPEQLECQSYLLTEGLLVYPEPSSDGEQRFAIVMNVSDKPCRISSDSTHASSEKR